MKFKIKPETAVSVALGVLGLVQMVLTNKKEAAEKQALKTEIMNDVINNLSQDKN